MRNDFLADNQYRAYPFADIPAANGVDVRDLLLAASVVTTTAEPVVVTQLDKSPLQLHVTIDGASVVVPITLNSAVAISSGFGKATFIFGPLERLDHILAASATVTNGTLLPTVQVVYPGGVRSVSLATELDPTFTGATLGARYQYAATARGLQGELTVAPGHNARVTVDPATNALQLSAIAGDGAGMPAGRFDLPDVPATGSTTTVVQTTAPTCRATIRGINGVSPDATNNIQITGGNGVAVKTSATGIEINIMPPKLDGEG